MPLKIACRDGEYFDGVDIFSSDIYRRLEAGELPKTSLPDFFTADRILSRIKADGYERVLAIHLSSGLSGTYNMVRLLCESRSDLEIAVFDSLSGALGMGISVLQAWEDIENGMFWDELVKERVPKLLANTYPFFSVDTLEYLAKGGRIGKVTAMAGTMLSIKPLITFAGDGQLQSIAKVRGRKAVQDKLIELVRKSLGDHKRYNLGGGQRRRTGGDGPAPSQNGAALPQLRPLLAGGDGRHPQRLHRQGRFGRLRPGAGLRQQNIVQAAGIFPPPVFSAADEKVENIHAGVVLGLVELGVTAPGAGDGIKLLVLDIEELGEVSAGGLELVVLIGHTAALGADILLLFHKSVTPYFPGKVGQRQFTGILQSLYKRQIENTI